MSLYINPPLYSDVHLRTPCHEPQTRDIWRLGVYVTVWTAAFLEDVLGNGPFSGSPPIVSPPPQKKILTARQGPGSRGAVPDLASDWPLDRPLEVITVRRWPEKLPISFLERFGSRLELILGTSWESLGPQKTICINAF